jgi:hypothetical protein
MINWKNKYLKMKVNYLKKKYNQNGGTLFPLPQTPQTKRPCYMIIQAHGVLLDDFIDNENNQIHFSCPEREETYLSICVKNDIEFRKEHGLPGLPLRKQHFVSTDTVSNYKDNISYPGDTIRNMSFGLHHTTFEAGPDESVYIYDENKQLLDYIDLRKEEIRGASPTFFTLKYILDMFSNDYSGGIVLVSACRGPSQGDLQQEMEEELDKIDWDNL